MNIFNRKNKYGKYLIEAIVPGWGSGRGSSDGVSGILRPIGKRSVEFTAQTLGSPFTGEMKERIYPYQFGAQSVKVIQVAQQDSNSGYRFRAPIGNLGPALGDNFTVVGICKLIGDGQQGTSDPRIYSKDLDSTEGGHDLMLGLRGGVYIKPRTRIRLDSTTRTVVLGDDLINNVVNDGWHLIAATCYKSSSTSSTVGIHGVYPDGRYRTTSSTHAGFYNPRTTTYEGLFANSGVADNTFHGSILAVYFFDGIVLGESDFRSLFQNPWQVFKSNRYFAHVDPYTPAITVEEQGPQTINESISFDIDLTATQINLLSAAASQSFTINLSETIAGDLGVTTLTITLVDSAGTPLQNLSGLNWAWFDESTVNSATTPPDVGTGATTDSAGVFSVDLTNTTLTSGQTGMLALQDSTGFIYALYRITLD